MSRTAAILLAEILEAIQRIEQYTTALTFEQFSANAEKQDAVLRQLSVEDLP